MPDSTRLCYRPIMARPRISDEQRAQLAQRYMSGASLRTLVTETGHSYGAVHAHLQRAGVTMRLRGGARVVDGADEQRDQINSKI